MRYYLRGKLKKELKIFVKLNPLIHWTQKFISV